MLERLQNKHQVGKRRGRYVPLMGVLLIALLLSPLLVRIFESSTVQERTRPRNQLGSEAVLKQSVHAAIGSVKPTARQRDWLGAKAIEVCFDIEQALHGLVPYTVTQCLPSQDAHGLSFMVISAKPIFSIYGAKKVWLTGIVGVMGKALNDHQELVVESVWVSDGGLMAKHQAFAFPGGFAKDLQRKAKADQIRLEALYPDVTKAMRKHPIPERWARPT
jgi:hypothetical protein